MDNKPFEFDIGEKVMLLLVTGKLWGPLTIVDRQAGPVRDGDNRFRAKDNQYELRGKRVAAGRSSRAGCIFAGWYLERNLRRTVLHQLMRARRSSCG